MVIPEVSLAETPGGYYMFAYWLAAMVLCVARMPHRQGLTRTIGLSVMALAALEIWPWMTAGIPLVAYPPSVAVCITLVFGFIAASCRLSAVQSAYYTVQVVMLGEFAASIEYQIYWYVITHWAVFDASLVNMGCLIVVHVAVFGTAWLVISRMEGGGADLLIGSGELLTAVCIGLFSYSLSNISYVLTDTPFSARLSSELFAIRTITDLCGLAMLLVFDLLIRERGLEMERASLRAMLQMQYRSYRISKESMDLVNRKYHDLKHQIALLRLQGVQGASDSPDDGGLQWLNRLEREIGRYESACRTGNDVLDTILTLTTERCRNLGITLTCVADGTVLDFIDPMDLSSLFGNAFDNAVEAVSQVPEGALRRIGCTVTARRGFVQIVVENGCVGSVDFRDGVPQSTKGDDAYHGFGYKSMREVARRYGGSIVASQDVDRGLFILRVLIPLMSRS